MVKPHPTSTLDRAVDLLRTLVRFDSVSRNSNLPLIAFVAEYLRGYHVEPVVIAGEGGKKANLYATIGPSERGGICLSGHSDVVPVGGQHWRHDPFDLTEEAGRLYGRGTADMKGYLAAVLASVPLFCAQSDAPLPVHIAVSYDEELGCKGIPGLLERLGRDLIKPRVCIIGEPTSMHAAVMHKGKRAWRCRVHGRTGHSAFPNLGVNAVEYGAELVTFLRRLARRLRVDGVHDERFEPPYTTVHTGRISGGIALNVIPELCEIEFGIRNLPADDITALFREIRGFAEATLLPEMRGVDPEASFEWEPTIDYPALEATQAGAPLRALVSRLLGDAHAGALSFGTEGGLYQQADVPTVICGPGSMAQGHKADEYVERAQLARCVEFLERLSAARSDPEILGLPATGTRLPR